ncbi:hypothetical protein BJV78DRAFT_1167398 [Lactifluus subvellereus]|nr:hypothetical protein BJV78DRAFT_1167398 [Lactifluus subvellereus]
MGDQQPAFLYYQIGGFRPNLTLQGEFRYDLRKLAEAIFGSKPLVELVLGIRPSGASAILVPTSEWIKKEDFNYPGTPQPASDFLSLSPLQFDNASQLARKLNALKPKGKRRGEDDSAANKIFLGDIGQAGQFRSAFEHSRLLFHAFKPSSDVSRFGLSRSSPWASAQVISLVFNEWTHEKGVFLDIGWSSMDCATRPPTFRTSVHLEVEDTRHFGNKGKQRVGFRYGETEVLKQSSVSTRVRDLLRCERPLILLVHDEGAVRTLFRGLGIDTDSMASGLKTFSKSRGVFRGRYTYKDSRRRSLSPRRDGGSRDQRPRSPPRTQKPVCLVDIRQMYITLCRRIAESNASLSAVAAELGLQGDDKSMCAGNESRLLAEMWMTMASGPAIDEQYGARWGADAARVSAIATQSASGGSAPSADPGDVDFDPNDLAPTGWAAAAQPSRPSQMMDWDDLDDDEEEFYGR